MAAGSVVAEVELSREAFEGATLMQTPAGAKLRMAFGDATVAASDA